MPAKEFGGCNYRRYAILLRPSQVHHRCATENISPNHGSWLLKAVLRQALRLKQQTQATLSRLLYIVFLSDISTNYSNEYRLA
jgi:hypothetical protein